MKLLAPIISAFRRALKFGSSHGSSQWRITPLWNYDSNLAFQQSNYLLLRDGMRNQIDLVQLFRGVAMEHRWWKLALLLRFVDRLQSGVPAMDAVDQTPGILNPSDALKLRFAIQSGLLSKLDRNETSDSQKFSLEDLKQSSKVNLVVVTIMTLVVLTVFSFFIEPAINRLITEIVDEKSRHEVLLLSKISGEVRLVAIMAAILISIIGLVWILQKDLLLATTRITRWLPFVRDRRSAEVLKMFAMNADSGRPLSATLSTLAKYHFDPDIRYELLHARNEIEQGYAPWKAVGSSGVLTLAESETVERTANSETQSWILRKIAENRIRRATDRAEFLHSLIHPAIVLLYGAIVGSVCYSLFGTLSQLTIRVAGWQ